MRNTLNHVASIHWPLTDLSSAVDVYSDWIDACETVAKETAGPPAPASSFREPQTSAPRAGLAPGEKYTDEDAGFIDDEDADAEADYADWAFYGFAAGCVDERCSTPKEKGKGIFETQQAPPPSRGTGSRTFAALSIDMHTCVQEDEGPRDPESTGLRLVGMSRP